MHHEGPLLSLQDEIKIEYLRIRMQGEHPSKRLFIPRLMTAGIRKWMTLSAGPCQLDLPKARFSKNAEVWQDPDELSQV